MYLLSQTNKTGFRLIHLPGVEAYIWLIMKFNFRFAVQSNRKFIWIYLKGRWFFSDPVEFVWFYKTISVRTYALYLLMKCINFHWKIDWKKINVNQNSWKLKCTILHLCLYAFKYSRWLRALQCLKNCP